MKKTNKPGIFLFSILTLCFLFGTVAFGQIKVTQDTSTNAKSDSTQKAIQPVYEEIVLQNIQIEAILEKPSVTLIPKKVKTDVGKVPLNIRSFDKELKTKPKSLSSYGEDLETGKKIKNIGKKPKK